MNKKQHTGVIFSVFLGIMLSLASVSSVMAAELLAPQKAIDNASRQLKEKLQDENFTKDFKEITKFVDEVIDPHVDFNRISALVLGKLWRQATKEERANFKKEFHTLLVRTYARAFVEFEDWSVRFLPLNMEQGAKKVVVKTEVLQPGIQPIGVNYRMILINGSWKAYDIMIEGVSLVTNYRTTFKNDVARKGSLQAVIDGLVKRNSEALSPKKTDNS